MIWSNRRAGRRRRRAAAIIGGGMLLLASQAAAQAADASPPGSPRQRAVAPDCPTCWVQEVQARAAAGAPQAAPANPTCYGQPGLDFFRSALAIVAPRMPATASGDLAAAIRGLARPIFEALREGSAADFRSLLRLPAGQVPYANCMPLAALLPVGARVRRMEVSVLGDAGLAQSCDPVGGACGDGGRFVQLPEAFSSQDRLGVGAVFVAAGAGAVAQLSVAYELPPGETPSSLP